MTSDDTLVRKLLKKNQLRGFLVFSLSLCADPISSLVRRSLILNRKKLTVKENK